MDELKKYIKENRNEFDASEPYNGHFNRFWNRLSFRTQTPIWQELIKIAAAVFIGVLISGAIYEFADEIEMNPQADLEMSLPLEFKEAQYFYKTEINARLEFIKHTPHINQEQFDFVLDNCKEMDRSLELLKHELLISSQNERVMNTILIHYRIKLEILDDLVSGIQMKKSYKNESMGIS